MKTLKMWKVSFETVHRNIVNIKHCKEKHLVLSSIKWIDNFKKAFFLPEKSRKCEADD